MSLTRAQTPRQLYENGSPSPAETLAEMVGVSVEEAQLILDNMENKESIKADYMSDDDREVMERLQMMQSGPDYQYDEENLYEGPRDMRMSGGMVDRQQYGLGSIVKKATKAVKKIASSDIGKAALLYAGTAGLGSLAAGGGFGSLFSASTYAPGMVGSNLLTGLTRAGVGASNLFSGAGGASKLLGGSSLKKAGVLLGGSALLTSLFGSPDQAQDAFIRNPEGVKKSLAQHYKNINKNATEEEVRKFVEQNVQEFGDVARSDVVQGYEGTYGRSVAAEGGIMDIPTGQIRQNQQGVIERDYRDQGGFVPVGIKEKADDVPAMLSKNEFVFTADAVKGLGNGDVEKGAQMMYDNMKRLEKRIV